MGKNKCIRAAYVPPWAESPAFPLSLLCCDCSLWDGWGLQQSVQKLPSTSLRMLRFAQGSTFSSVAELNLAMGGRATKAPILVLTASKSLPRWDNFGKLQTHVGRSTRAPLSACFVKLKWNSSTAALICGSKKYLIRKSSGTC